MKYYYINLKNSKKRKINMENFFKKLEVYIQEKINYQRIEAFNGRTENIDDYLINCKFNNLKSIYFTEDKSYLTLTISLNYDKIKIKNLNQGEFGCLYSHIKAMNSFLNTNEDICVICEDDLDYNFIYNPDFLKNKIKYLSSIIDTFGIISLSCVGNINLIKRILNNFQKDDNLYKFKEYFFYGTGSYMINRKTAEKIINNFTVVDNNKLKLKFDNTNQSLVADNFIYSQANTHFYLPSLFFTNNFDSIINNNVNNQYLVQNLMKKNINYIEEDKLKTKVNKINSKNKLMFYLK